MQHGPHSWSVLFCWSVSSVSILPSHFCALYMDACMGWIRVNPAWLMWWDAAAAEPVPFDSIGATNLNDRLTHRGAIKMTRLAELIAARSQRSLPSVHSTQHQFTVDWMEVVDSSGQQQHAAHSTYPHSLQHHTSTVWWWPFPVHMLTLSLEVSCSVTLVGWYIVVVNSLFSSMPFHVLCVHCM